MNAGEIVQYNLGDSYRRTDYREWEAAYTEIVGNDPKPIYPSKPVKPIWDPDYYQDREDYEWQLREYDKQLAKYEKEFTEKGIVGAYIGSLNSLHQWLRLLRGKLISGYRDRLRVHDFDVLKWWLPSNAFLYRNLNLYDLESYMRKEDYEED